MARNLGTNMASSRKVVANQAGIHRTKKDCNMSFFDDTIRSTQGIDNTKQTKNV